MRLPILQTLRHNEVVLTLVTTTAIAMMGNGAIVPVLPLYAQSFGVTIFLIGLMVAAYGLARMVMDIPAGRLADRFGRRPMIIFGVILLSASSLASAAATNFWQLVALRLVMGTGSAIYITTSQTALADLSTVQNRGQFLSLHQGAHQVGNTFGPAVGGFLAEYFGLRAPFIGYAGIAFLAAVWAYLRIPETYRVKARSANSALPTSLQPNNPADHHPSTAVMKTLVRDGSFLLVALLTLNNFFIHSGAQQTIVPLYGKQRLNLTEGQLGLAMTVIGLTTLITAFLAGWVSDRVGRKKVIVPGMITLGLSVTLFGISNHIIVFIAAAAVMGLSRGFAGSVPAAYAADIAPGGNFGATLGLYRTFGDIGFMIGPLLMGWIADATGSLSLSLFSASAFMIVGTILFGLFARETVKK